MPSPTIEWLAESDIWGLIARLQKTYRKDPIRVINLGPIEYVLNLQKLSYLYDDDPLYVAAAKIRTIIQGHPLLDGNKRLGIFVGDYFLRRNSIRLTASDENIFEIAIGLASGNFGIEDLFEWIKLNTFAE